VQERVLNLIEDPWIPVISGDGETQKLAPWEIFDHGKVDESSHIATTRPDFQGSIIQFLIGLVQTTMAPGDTNEWVEMLPSLPDAPSVRNLFLSVSPAFNLGGEGPRFMQDRTCEDGKEQPIETLVIGMPGENSLRMNRDFFLKRGTVQALCPACAAMALMTLQINGPPGGAGHRTGLRGGGPVTSIVLGKTLPETIWLNVLPENEFFMGTGPGQKKEMKDIFPWMGPLRTSGKETGGQTTSISDVSQLQMYWGMGRRILLNFGEEEETTCEICGEVTGNPVRSLKTKPYGVRYDESWRHCLTPYYRSKDDVLPVHMKAGGITYQHWLGIVQNDPEGGIETARVVQRFRNIQPLLWGMLPEVPRLWAFGYHFDKVKALCWYDSTMPLIPIGAEIREEYELCTAQLVRAASFGNRMTGQAVRDALYSPDTDEIMFKTRSGSQKTPSGLPIVTSRFWGETEPLFYDALTRLKEALETGAPVDAVKRDWVLDLRRVALSLFDLYAQVAYIDLFRPAAVVRARKQLARTVSPGAPKMMKILGLSREVET